MAYDTKEKHALVDASHAFEQHGIDFKLPWECSMDDLERDRFQALLEACRAYHSWMKV